MRVELVWVQVLCGASCWAGAGTNAPSPGSDGSSTLCPDGQDVHLGPGIFGECLLVPH